MFQYARLLDMSTFVCVCVRIHTYIYMHTYIYICIHTHVCIHTYICIHTLVSVRFLVSHTYKTASLGFFRTYSYMYIYIYTHVAIRRATWHAYNVSPGDLQPHPARNSGDAHPAWPEGVVQKSHQPEIWRGETVSEGALGFWYWCGGEGGGRGVGVVVDLGVGVGLGIGAGVFWEVGRGL